MKSFISVLALLASLQLHAQKGTKLPEFGKVDIADLKMPECSFEKDASAMILFSEAESTFDMSGFEQTEHRVRIKIFNKKGFENANIKIKYPFDVREASIKHLSAQTYNLDAGGNVLISKVDKVSIFDKKINKRYSEKSFAFPDVKEGSVIEYKYTLDGSSETYWYFQKPIPVAYSQFTIDFPKELIISVVPHTSLPIKKLDVKALANNIATEYSMSNIPGLSDEAFMSCREDYLQRMEARLIAIDLDGQPTRNLVRTWPGIIKELLDDEDFGLQLKKNIPRTSDLDEMLKSVTDPYKKMCIIHKYVRTKMEWNNYDNIWALEGVKSAWKDKKGTSGEINLILINLLRDADLDAHPLLVSTRDNGTVNTSVAGYDQFDKVLAYVTVDKKNYVLDATEKNTPSYLMPPEVIASEGLLIEKADNYAWGWKVLWDDVYQDENNVIISAEIDDHHLMKGAATVSSKDYNKIDKLALFKQGADKLKEKMRSSPDIKIDSFEVTGNNDEELPLTQTFKFSMPASTTGDYHYFTANLFAGLDKNPFVADERQSDIFFGAKQHYSITANIDLPKGYVIEELPKSLKMIMPDTSIVFTRHCSFNDNFLAVSYSLDIKMPVYTIENYPDFNAFYKKLFEMLNESFVYKKK
ncbi:MAG: DUF3857 domain-containing protein [Ferruginibacter sp.]